MKHTLLILAVSLLLTSCYTSKILVGGMDPNQALVKVKEQKNHILLYGLVPISKPLDAKSVMKDNDKYLIKTNRTFLDQLIQGLTFGIYTPTTTYIYATFDGMN